MCLTISIEASADERDTLTAAATAASGFGLHVEVDRLSRWPWARHRPVRVSITEAGGCACSLLADGASWDAETWEMRHDVVEPLARTLQTMLEHGPPRMSVEALWAGDRPNVEVVVTPGDLAALVHGDGLGTMTRYVTERGGVTARRR
jgi:hypothetical protein